MASSRSISREDEVEFLDQFDNGYMETSRTGSYNSEDDEHFSDDSQHGGKRSTIRNISHHSYGTDLVVINEDKCAAPCYLTLKNGDRVDCVCAKDSDSCSRHRGKKFERCPDGFYQRAPVKTQSSDPAGLLRAGCAAHKHDPNAVIKGFTNHEGKRTVTLTQEDAERHESAGWFNGYPFDSPATAFTWMESGIRPNQQGKKTLRSRRHSSRSRSPSRLRLSSSAPSSIKKSLNNELLQAELKAADENFDSKRSSAKKKSGPRRSARLASSTTKVVKKPTAVNTSSKKVSKPKVSSKKTVYDLSPPPSSSDSPPSSSEDSEHGNHRRSSSRNHRSTRHHRSSSSSSDSPSSSSSSNDDQKKKS